MPAGEGWFVLNAREARWSHAAGRTAVCEFEGEIPFGQIGVNLSVLKPGEAMSRYHWEADQEDFLVLSGDALLIVDGEERPLSAWDFVHCPPVVSHVILGAGVQEETTDPSEAYSGLPQRRPTAYDPTWLPR